MAVVVTRLGPVGAPVLMPSKPGSAPGNRYGWLQHLRSCMTSICSFFHALFSLSCCRRAAYSQPRFGRVLRHQPQHDHLYQIRYQNFNFCVRCADTHRDCGRTLGLEVGQHLGVARQQAAIPDRLHGAQWACDARLHLRGGTGLKGAYGMGQAQCGATSVALSSSN